MQRLYGFTLETVCLWLGAFLIGAMAGMRLVNRDQLKVDRSRGVIHRPADMSVLPLMLLAFASKYAFGVLQAIDPQTTAQPWFMVTETLTYGVFAGLFAGKFARYLQAYRAAPNTETLVDKW